MPAKLYGRRRMVQAVAAALLPAAALLKQSARAEAPAVRSADRVPDYFSWIQAVFWVSGVGVATIGAMTLRQNFSKNRYEARWNEVEKAQQLVQRIFDDKWAHYGLRMLDGSLVTIPLLEEFQKQNAVQQTRDFSPEMIIPALSNPIGRDSDIPLAHTITHCFDSLFNHFHMIELYIEHKLVSFSSIEDSFQYYMNFVLRKRDVFEAYAIRICYPKAKRFIGRFHLTEAS